MKRIIFFILLLMLFFAGVAWVLYWRSDRRQVTVLVEKMIKIAEKERSELPHQGILKFAGSEKIFSDPVNVYSEYPRFDRKLNKEECRAMLAFLHRRVQFFTVKMADFHVNISGHSADFTFNAQISAGFKNGSSSNDILLVRGRAEKKENVWRISELTAGQVLKK